MGKIMRNHSGFTLVELLIAIVIVGVILITITTFLKNSLLLRGDSRGSEVAYMLSEEKLIELETSVNPVESSDTVKVDGLYYIRTWKIAPISGSSIIPVATVRVQYKYSGRVKSLECSRGIN